MNGLWDFCIQFVLTMELDNYIVVWKLVACTDIKYPGINWDATTCRALAQVLQLYYTLSTAVTEYIEHTQLFGTG